MQTILHNCCGLDVHKDSVVACIVKSRKPILIEHRSEDTEKEIRVFATFPNDLLQLRTWLESENCCHVAMESTGVYWFPIYDVLEDACNGKMEIIVANARHMKNVPGKKTDIKDAEWIASLLRAGLLASSFIPPREVRELRQFTRYRKTIVEDIGTQKNRIGKSLQQAGFKLSTFLSDIFGMSGRNLIRVLIDKGCLSDSDVETETRRISQAKKRI
jgi:transposase